MKTIRIQLEDIAMKKRWIERDSKEAEEIREKWNALVPKAEREGITHSEMSLIWATEIWGEAL